MGALATVRQDGDAVGVAVVGVIFFDALSAGYSHAFELSLVLLAAIVVGLVALSRLLPRTDASPR